MSCSTWRPAARSSGAARTNPSAKPPYVPVYFYRFERPGFVYPSIAIEHDEAGKGQITFVKDGNDIAIADPAASRELAHRMNAVRDAARHPDRTVNPGALNAMGLLDEVTHIVLAQYRAAQPLTLGQ